MNTKTLKQQQIVDKWITKSCIGGLEAATGFGKTFTAILAIKRLQHLNFKCDKIIVIVPTIVLKEQWTLLLKENNINAVVYVINTASKLTEVCDLLIIDEAHSVLAPTFKAIFEGISYDKLFWLTATVERVDGEHKLLLEKAPIVDTVSLTECLKNNWISPYQVFNIPVPFDKTQQIAYNKADNAFKYYAMQIGYGSFDTAKKWLVSGTPAEKGLAACYYNSMRKRKQIISENLAKVDTTVKIINKFSSSKYIIFSESIKFVTDLVAVESSCLPVHSKMTKKKQKESFDLFNSSKLYRGIASCKALTSGLDIPELDLAIIASFNSSKLINTQSIGRVVRKSDNKQAKIINLYTPFTQELNWLNKKQEGQVNIKWLNSINDL